MMALTFVCAQVLASLRMLLLMKPSVLFANCRQIAFGLYDMLRTNAANIHTSHDWYTLFMLLECVGAGAAPRAVRQVMALHDNGMVEADQRSTGEPGRLNWLPFIKNTPQSWNLNKQSHAGTRFDR